MAKTHCKQGHPFTPENTRYNKNGWQICIACHRAADRKTAANRSLERKQELLEYGRQWRLDNLEQSRNLAKRHYNRIRDIIEEAKAVPCMDCGLSFPHYVIDFDHRDPSEKKLNVGRTRGLVSTKEEIAKCDVVCANCHRIRTWKDVTRWAEGTES